MGSQCGAVAAADYLDRADVAECPCCQSVCDSAGQPAGGAAFPLWRIAAGAASARRRAGSAAGRSVVRIAAVDAGVFCVLDAWPLASANAIAAGHGVGGSRLPDAVASQRTGAAL